MLFRFNNFTAAREKRKTKLKKKSNEMINNLWKLVANLKPPNCIRSGKKNQIMSMIIIRWITKKFLIWRKMRKTFNLQNWKKSRKKWHLIGPLNMEPQINFHWRQLQYIFAIKSCNIDWSCKSLPMSFEIHTGRHHTAISLLCFNYSTAHKWWKKKWISIFNV